MSVWPIWEGSGETAVLEVGVLDVFSLASLQHPYLKVSRPPRPPISSLLSGRSPLKRSS